ncbi:hypothetical protein BDZ97DRAFT_1783107 [Flammula alnicola]|nr:hypothetical protein BDZ97DRAFT_1783107 [Flammula alnicola]
MTFQLHIEELAQSPFLVLGGNDGSNGLAGRSPGFSLYELKDLEDHLLLALSQTRMLKNSSALVNRLPPEVLARIFGLLQSAVLETTFPLPESFNAWLIVTRVCRRWRNTALAFPRLWSHIYIRNPSDRIATLSSMNSAQTLLSVYCAIHTANDRQSSTDENAIRLMAAQMYRIRELHISWERLSESSLRELVVPPTPAPNLEVLSIIGQPNDGYPDYDLLPLFLNRTPQLKKITFTRISSWPHNSFCGLTHLSLYDQQDRRRIPLSDFLDVLQSSPDLEELILVRAGPDGRITEIPTERSSIKVALPRLRTIELGEWSSGESISFFLSHLIIPESTTQRFWGDFLGDVSTLLNTEIHDPFAHLSRIAIMGHEFGTQLIGIRNSTLYIHGSVSFSQSESIFDKSLLPNIKELILCPISQTTPSTTEIRRIVSCFTGLETFTITGFARWKLARLVQALGLFDDEQGDDSALPAPDLQTLRVLHYNPRCEDPQPFDCLPLVLLLQARAEVEHPIRTLEIENGRADEVELLQSYVGSVRQVYRAQTEWSEDELLNDMWRSIHISSPKF